MFAFEALSALSPLWGLWLAVSSAASGLALFGLICRIRRFGRVSRPAWVSWSLASLCPLAVCCSDAARRLNVALPDSLALAGQVALLGLLAAAAYGISRRHVRETQGAHSGAHSGSPVHRPRAAWHVSRALVIANGLAAAWAAACVYEAVAAEVPSPTAMNSGATWVKVEGAEGLTDGGTPIPLLKADTALPPNESPLLALLSEHFRERVIEVADDDDRCNAHGWVFAAGRFAVADQDVDTILADNGYEQVQQPEAGDLIVYRDDESRAVHSGIVRLADSDLVMVESKWGAYGRYLHRPPDQAYATSCEFYRSPRQSHYGHLIDLSDEQSAEVGVAAAAREAAGQADRTE